ncbi:MAG: hypothetical protein GY757_28250 [bacterium]|nr:hypothetical protein [bacterium]
MGNNNDIHADLVCKKGVIKIGNNNDIDGVVYAMELKSGNNNDMGKFHKTEVPK